MLELTMSPLSVSIPIVVALSAQEKMVGVNAWRIIAFMKNAQSVWDRSIVDFPRNSVRSNRTLINTAPDMAVTKVRFTPAPNPTAISFFDLRPKPFLYWNRFLSGLICGVFCATLWGATKCFGSLIHLLGSAFIYLEKKTTCGTIDLHSKKLNLSYCVRGGQTQSVYPELHSDYHYTNPCKL